MRKPVLGVSDQVRLKPGCSATEDCKRLEILYLKGVEGLYYPCSENKGTKLICVFVFAYAKSRFSHDAAQLIADSQDS